MPITGSTVADFYVGKLTITSGVDSFNEVYSFTPGTTRTQAQSGLGLILKARSRLISGDLTIQKARVSLSGGVRDKFPATGVTNTDYAPILIGAEVAIEASNATGDGLDFRFETGDGKFATRAVKGVRDSWIAGNLFTVTPAASYPIGGPYLTYGVGDAEADVVSNYLSIVRDLTALYVYDSISGLYQPYTFATWRFRRVTRRKVGGKYNLGRGRQRNYA